MSHIVSRRAIIAVPTRVSGCGLGGLRYLRRLFATSRYARGFSFGVHRKHGLIAPVPSYGLMPCRKPSGLSLPKERSANLHGVSHLLGGWWVTSYSLSLGIQAMMLTLSSSVSTAFSTPPEPVFKPVFSVAGEETSPYDVSHDVTVIVDLIVGEYRAASKEKNPLNYYTRLNALRSIVNEITDICDEINGLTCTAL